MGLNLYLIFALVSTSLLGLIKIFSIIPFNRMAADDFSFTVNLLYNSFFYSQRAWYMSLTGRYTSNLLITIFGVMSSPSGKTILFSVFTIILGFFSLAFFINSLIKIRILSWKNILLTSILFVTYYVITPSQRDSWYWLNGVATYLWPTFFDLIVVSLLLRKFKSRWIYLFLFLFTFLAGGGNECILVINVIVSGLAVVSLLVWKLNSNYRDIFPKIVKIIKSRGVVFKQTLFVFLTVVLSLGIVYLSPGNKGRLGASSSNPMKPLGSIAYSFRDGPLLVGEIFKDNLMLIIPLFLTLVYLFAKWVFVGKKLGKVKNENLINLALFTISAPVLLSIPFTLIGYLSLGRILPDRAFVTVSFVMLICLIMAAYFLSFLIRTWSENAQRWFDRIAAISSILVFLFGFRIVSTLAEDVYIAKNYSQSFDAMFNQLKNLPPIENQKILEVEQLPPSGLIRFWQVTAFPENWENQAVSAFFKINATIVAK